VFRKTRAEASASALTVGLPEERKALATRYTIDAQEAASHAQRAAEDERRRDAESRDRRETVPEARRDAAAVAQRRDIVSPEPAGVAPAPGGAFPIYGWLQRSTPAPDDTVDWTRALLKTQEEKERGETPRI
jgi:hypothetical protein